MNKAVIGLQWGDEGKGKIVDFLSEKFDLVARYQGGNNAGHTVIVEDITYKLNLIPSGVIRGKICFLGQGIVLDPEHFINEYEQICEKISNFMKENFIEDLKYFEEKNKIKIDIISDNSLIIPEYIVNLQNKTKKTIEKIEMITRLKNLEDIKKDNGKNNSKNIISKSNYKKNDFKKKKFYKKKYFKKTKSNLLEEKKA